MEPNNLIVFYAGLKLEHLVVIVNQRGLLNGSQQSVSKFHER